MRANWWLWEKDLDVELCDKFVNICCSSLMLEDAAVGNTTSNKSTINKKKRSCKTQGTKNPEINQLVVGYLMDANRHFGFDISWIPPATQFAQYSKGNYYKWHSDVNWHNKEMFDRKLSIVIQLSDPKDYDAGDFEFFDEGGNGKFRGKGSVLVFPSVHMHRVTEVTSGVRYSLVSWAEGLRWR